LKTLILTSKEIQKIIDMDMVIEAVEDAFAEYGRGKTIMPAKVYLPLEQYNGDFRAMPAFVKGSAGLKWVNAHPLNRREFNLPAVMAVFIYSDPKTGFPLAVMDGTIITNYRTGAAGAVAAKYLAKEGSKSLGLIGCGAQAKSQLAAISRIFDLRVTRIFDVSESRMNAFASDNSAFQIERGRIEEVAASDIVCTTTPVREPIIKRNWVREGTHINAVGADAAGKQELEAAILWDAKVVVDDVTQASHSGEINVPLRSGDYQREDIYASLGEIVAGKKPGREANEITIFDSTGLAIQDVATAGVIFEKAKELGIGSEIDFVSQE
jgi:alanine dehydrogenase